MQLTIYCLESAAGCDQDARMAYSVLQRNNGRKPARRTCLGCAGCKAETVLIGLKGLMG